MLCCGRGVKEMEITDPSPVACEKEGKNPQAVEEESSFANEVFYDAREEITEFIKKAVRMNSQPELVKEKSNRRRRKLKSIIEDVRLLRGIAMTSNTAGTEAFVLKGGRRTVSDDKVKPFIGPWTHVSSEHYKEFLQDGLGLGWAKASIGARINPEPTFEMKDNHLHCTTACFGAKDVIEILNEGEGEFTEPNLNVQYKITAKWETMEHGAATFVSSRVSAKINKGVPTVQKRWVDPSTDELIVEQDWGAKYKCTVRYKRGSPSDSKKK